MANTVSFTNLAPILYRSMDRVARELSGFIPSSMVNASGVTIAAQGDKVQSLRTTEAIDKASYTPAMQIPESGNKTNVMDEFAIDQYVGKELPLTGENTKKLQNIASYGQWVEDEFAQMMRSAVNEMEAYLGEIAYKAASRAYGTAGSNPFASNIAAIGNLRKILKDNGCPTMDGMLSLVLDTTAGSAGIGNLAQLQKVNESGDTGLLRQGILGQLGGFNIRESAGVALHTKGTATGFDAAGGEPLGETVVAVDGSDAGTILAGDVVTFAGDANKYVINSATASGNAAGNITLNRPGLQAALADTVEGTIGNSFTANVAFHRNAIEFAARAPAMPEGGDAATDSMIIVDPISGIPFEFRMYKGYGMNKIELNIFYGGIAWKPEFIALLLG
jgi:hypothetical protein